MTNRLYVFDDSDELVEMLRERDDYLSLECAVHIAGLWELAQEQAEYITKLQGS